MSSKKAAFGAAVAGVLTAATLGLSAVAGAQPQPEPPGGQGEPVPTWAPRKPAEVWNGAPIVWTSGWGGRWGVWINGMFIPLSSNVVTNGG